MKYLTVDSYWPLHGYILDPNWHSCTEY